MVAGRARAGHPSQHTQARLLPSVWEGARLSPTRHLLQLQLLQLRPTRIDRALVFVIRRIGVIQRLAADRAKTGAVGSTEELGRNRQHRGVVCPAAEVELVVDHVGAEQLLVFGVFLGVRV